MNVHVCTVYVHVLAMLIAFPYKNNMFSVQIFSVKYIYTSISLNAFNFAGFVILSCCFVLQKHRKACELLEEAQILAGAEDGPFAPKLMVQCMCTKMKF